jgi:UDP-2,3-diacylglucosamine hydrolase
MRQGSAFVTSDVHLGAVPQAAEEAFHGWLRWAGERGSLLVINGDLFDFWFEYRSVIPRGYSRTLGILADLVDDGLPVHLVGGNHDWWGGTFLTDEIGVHFHREPVTLELTGRRCLIAHGDGLGRGDLGYRALRTVLRGRFTQWAFRWLHPDIGARVARHVSRTELRTEAEEDPPSSREMELRSWASLQLEEDDSLDAVLLGHTHRPSCMEIVPGRYYLNSGDWLQHQSFLTFPPDGPIRLSSWDESKGVIAMDEVGDSLAT